VIKKNRRQRDDRGIGLRISFDDDLPRGFMVFATVGARNIEPERIRRRFGDEVAARKGKNLGGKIERRIRGNGIPIDIRDKTSNLFLAMMAIGQGTGLSISYYIAYFSFASLLLASYIARVKIADRASKIDDRKIHPIDPPSSIFYPRSS
jgi:hypothetical protein